MKPLLIPCQGEQLVGILEEPSVAAEGPGHDLAVLIVVGGPQYRAGSHRLFTQLARDLAAAGLPCLRFDVRGMGDSTGDQRSFEALSDDIAAAVDALQQAQPQVRRVVLWGLCDGASAALLYCHERGDTRVAGLCLLNPWVRSEATLARTHVKHYYLQRLRDGEFWKKLARGQVAGPAVRELWANLRRAWLTPAGSGGAAGGANANSNNSPYNGTTTPTLPFPARMAQGLKRSAVPTLTILSGRDLTAREFQDHSAQDTHWKAAAQALGAKARTLNLQDADHTFSESVQAQALMEATRQWCMELGA